MYFCLVASSREERRCCLLSFTLRPCSLPAARTIGKIPERRRPHGLEHHQVPGPARARAPVRASRARAARPDLPRRSAGDGGDQVRGCPIPPPLSPRRARGCLARGLRLNASVGLYRGGALGAVGGGLEVPMGPADPSISPRTPMEGVLNATPSRVLSDGNSCDFVFGPRRDRCSRFSLLFALGRRCAHIARR